MTNNEKAMYTGLCICRNTEVTQRWARTQVFLLIHSLGISIIADAANKQRPTSYFLFIMSFVGLTLTVFWFFTNWRTNQWMIYWQTKLADFERSTVDPGAVSLFTGQEWDEMLKSPIWFHRIINFLIGAFAFGWIGVLIWAFSL